MITVDTKDHNGEVICPGPQSLWLYVSAFYKFVKDNAGSWCPHWKNTVPEEGLKKSLIATKKDGEKS